ncbi:sulfotransferase, partial [Candidatus Poribacteria bacterium]|nr:sulfotransferase [Candidatus Poribacteria bacterium]
MNKNDVVQQIPFMIVGSQKSGTSSLLRYLAQHPEIYAHPQPEMTYFLHDHEYEKGFKSAYNKYYSECPDNNRLIAKNVMVMCSPERIQRIYEHNPEMHLVVLLREPVARAYSAYWWARRRGWENIKSFEEALEAEDKRLKDDW